MPNTTTRSLPQVYESMNPRDAELQADTISEKDAFGAMYSRVDRLFMVVMLVQAAGLVALSVLMTPRTWAGTTSSVHIHVWASIGLGLLITVFPAMLTMARPSELSTRLVMEVSQSLVSSLLIHIGGGRLEMHFHIFVSLAFLAMYMDFKVLLAATIVAASDHLIRGLYWPQSVYGISEAGILRSLEHALWVVFEDVVLFFSISRLRRERLQLMVAVMRINECVHSITGTRARSGSEVEAIDAGLETIRQAMSRDAVPL